MSEFESLAGDEALARHIARHRVDRLIMLSDGVFAIAITLAAIELHVPTGGTFGEIMAAMAVPLITYLISFLVIAVFWVSNRDLFARVARVDRPLTGLVLATLCLVALIPPAVRVTGPTHGALGGAFRLYALVMMVTGLLNTALWAYAGFGRGVMRAEVPRRFRIRRVVECATLPLLFGIIAVAPTTATLQVVGILSLAVVTVRRILLRRYLREPA